MKRTGLILLCSIIVLLCSKHVLAFNGNIPKEENIVKENENEIKETDLYARAAVLMDARSGRVLYEKNGEEKLPMASTTKIMTLIVTLENADLNDTVTISDYAASMPDVQLNIRKGEQYRLKDLVYSLMLESHNDTAAAIAEHIGGKSLKEKDPAKRSRDESREAVAVFCELMNKKAAELSCKNTCFLTPNGLDRQEDGRFHSTTAKDLAGIMSYCITKSPKKEQFLEITQTQEYSFANMEGTRSFSCHNHNAFLGMMEGALSGKTGFTGTAGYCYVGALQNRERIFTVSLLACGWPNHKTYKWSDTRKLMEYGLENYTLHTFEEAKVDEKYLQPVSVENSQSETLGKEAVVSVIRKPDGREAPAGILLKPGEKISIRAERQEHLSAPVQKEQHIGIIQYMAGNEVWKTEELVAGEAVEEIDFLWCLGQVWKRYL